jgi:NAD+ kinase
MNKNIKIGLVADLSSEASVSAFHKIMEKYNFIDANQSNTGDLDVVIVLGGDGLMLKVMHRFINKSVKFFGMNRGSIGFLLNRFEVEGLIDRIKNARTITLHPLEMIAVTTEGEGRAELAINEVSLLRQTSQSAKIRIFIDGKVRLEELIADGIIVSTPAGSTAYNFAANGPIIPLGANILAMTPLAPFRPRRWRSVLLSQDKVVKFQILEQQKRPVSAVADFHEVRDVSEITVRQNKNIKISLLFDSESTFEERIINEQFIG